MEKEILQAIREADIIIIQRHQRPDPDAVGSQLGLKESLKATYPDKEVYAVGIDEPSLEYIGLMDKVEDDTFKKATVIVNDTANKERIDDQRYQLAPVLIKVDHHPNLEPYGTFQHVEEFASSASEVWARTVLDDSNELKMTKEAAKNFFMGIVGDTGRFLFDNTEPRTLHLAGDLLSYGFPASQLMQEAGTRSLNQLHLEGYVYEHLQLSQSKTSAWVILPKDVLNEMEVADNETYMIAQEPGAIKGVLAWAVFIQQEDKTYRVRLRSKGPAINGLAGKFGGGGHDKASGANARNEEEINRLLQNLEELTTQFKA